MIILVAESTNSTWRLLAIFRGKGSSRQFWCESVDYWHGGIRREFYVHILNWKQVSGGLM